MSSTSLIQRVMYSNVPADADVVSAGRNGAVKTIGLELYLGHPERIDITPITSQGIPAKHAFIGVPRQKDTLKALAKALNAVADSL